MNKNDYILWWGYVHVNGSVQAKRYWDDRDRKDATKSPFVQKVYGPFHAENGDEALRFVTNLAS